MGVNDTFQIKTDLTDEVLLAKNEQVVKALKAISLLMENNAKIEITKKIYDTPPSESGYKRTGRLRNSITSESDGQSAQVGTNVEYAIYNEMGTYKMKARPFIKPSVEEHLDEYKAVFDRVLKGGA